MIPKWTGQTTGLSFGELQKRTVPQTDLRLAVDSALGSEAKVVKHRDRGLICLLRRHRRRRFELAPPPSLADNAMARESCLAARPLARISAGKAGNVPVLSGPAGPPENISGGAPWPAAAGLPRPAPPGHQRPGHRGGSGRCWDARPILPAIAAMLIGTRRTQCPQHRTTVPPALQ